MSASYQRMCLYDADCGICTALVRFGQRLDRDQRIEFVANYEEERFPPSVTQELVRQTIVVVEAERSQVLIRAAAVASLLRVLPRWKWLGWLMALPGIHFICDRMYRLVANNRIHISRAFGLGVCRVPEHGGDRGSH